MYFAKLDALLKSCFSIPATATKSSLPCYIFCNKFPINKRECEIKEIPIQPILPIFFLQTFLLLYTCRHQTYRVSASVKTG